MKKLLIIAGIVSLFSCSTLRTYKMEDLKDDSLQAKLEIRDGNLFTLSQTTVKQGNVFTEMHGGSVEKLRGLNISHLNLKGRWKKILLECRCTHTTFPCVWTKMVILKDDKMVYWHR